MKKNSTFCKKCKLYFSCSSRTQIIILFNKNDNTMNMVDIEGDRFFYSRVIEDKIEDTNLAVYEWTYLEARLIRTAVK